MKRRIFTACIWFLLVSFGCMACLSGLAELERRDAAELAEMQKKHRAEELARIYGELSAKGCYMTSCDSLPKK